MASYSIEWKHSARKELKKLPRHMIGKIIATIEQLSRDPIPINSRKVLGTEYSYGIRVGNYRIIQRCPVRIY